MLTYTKEYRTEDDAKRRMLAEVEHMSRGLTRKEVLANFGFFEDEFAQEDEAFIRDFEIAFLKGRSGAKREAVDKLFNQMNNTRGGEKACLEYLSRFGEKWSDEDESFFSMNFGKDK